MKEKPKPSTKLEERAKEMADLVREIDDIQRAKRETAKAFNEQLEEKLALLSAIATDVRDGQMQLEDAADGE